MPLIVDYVVCGADEVARLLGIAPQSLRKYAHRHALGHRLGADRGVRVFTDEDIERLRRRPKPGRPRKTLAPTS